LESVPALRDQALKAQVYAYREMQKPDEAIVVLERTIAPDIKTPEQASAAITLALMYADRKQSARVLVLVRKLETKTALIDNVVALNAISVKTGDELLEQKQYSEALSMYRAVRPSAEVIRFQTSKISGIAARMEANLKAAIGNAAQMAQAQVTNSQLKVDLEQAKELLAEYNKLPDFLDPTKLDNFRPELTDRRHFHGYHILGRKTVAQAGELKEWRRGSIEGLVPSTSAFCFEPRHALRIRTRDSITDVVLCFECGQMRIFGLPPDQKLHNYFFDETVLGWINRLLDANRIGRNFPR
jgi:hypothetical protein